MNDAVPWAEVSGLFMEGGVMVRLAAPDDLITGRAAIMAAFEGRPPRTTRYVCANVVLDVESAAAARGSSATPLYTSNDRTPLIGGFDDRITKTAAGWRFAARRKTLTF